MDNTVVLIRRQEELFFTENSSGELEPISGEIERGQTLRESMRENVREITGIEVEIEKKIKRVENEENRTHWYLAKELTASEENPDPEEIDQEEGKWIQMEDATELDNEAAEFIEEHLDEIKS